MLVSEVPALRDYWYPVGWAGDVGPDPIAARVFGEDLVIWRAQPGAAPSAARDRCPHRAARLSQGSIEDGRLTCPYHGWQFDEGGVCVAIPANDPELPIPSRARLAPVPARDRYGLVWVCVGEPRHPLPELPEAEDDGYTVIPELAEVWGASAPRIVDNALDVSHVAFVHRDTVGDRSRPRLSEFEVERDGDRLRFSVTLTSLVRGVQTSNTGLSGAVDRTTHAELVQPFVFRGVLEYENGLRHVLFKTCTPVDDERTLFIQFIARNDHPPRDRWDAIRSVDREVQREDRRLLEGIEADFPLDTTSELHTRSDRMTIEYRRILAGIRDADVALHA